MFEQKLVVFSDKTYTDKFDVIADLARLVEDKVTDCHSYEEDVKERESVMATYIEYGVAIPHAKADSVKEPFVVYGKLAHPVQWGGEDEIASHVFMIGVPKESAGNLHLKIISELSKSLLRDNFRNALLNAATPEEAYGYLREIEKEIEQ